LWQVAEDLPLSVAVNKKIIGTVEKIGAGRSGHAHNLTPVVDTKSITRTEVCHLSIAIEKHARAVGCLGKAGDLPGIVDAVSRTVDSAESAEVLYLAVTVKESMLADALR